MPPAEGWPGQAQVRAQDLLGAVKSLQKQFVGFSGVCGGICQSAETQRREISDRRKSCATQKLQPSSRHSPVIHHWFNTNSLGKINALRFEDGYLIHKSYSSCSCRAAEDILIRKMPSQPPLLSLEGLVASYLQEYKVSSVRKGLASAQTLNLLLLL